MVVVTNWLQCKSYANPIILIFCSSTQINRRGKGHEGTHDAAKATKGALGPSDAVGAAKATPTASGKKTFIRNHQGSRSVASRLKQKAVATWLKPKKGRVRMNNIFIKCCDSLIDW